MSPLVVSPSQPLTPRATFSLPPATTPSTIFQQVPTAPFLLPTPLRRWAWNGAPSPKRTSSSAPQTALTVVILPQSVLPKRSQLAVVLSSPALVAFRLLR